MTIGILKREMIDAREEVTTKKLTKEEIEKYSKYTGSGIKATKGNIPGQKNKDGTLKDHWR